MPSRAIIAGYVRMHSEVDPKPILMNLAARGHTMALPAIETDQAAALTFRLFESEAVLIAGPYGVLMPPKSALSVEPDIIIVPLLAFDRTGHRLGYGAGYYDRTIEMLRARRKILTVGLAYAVQEVDSVLPEGHDQALDWIVTEKEAIRVSP